MRKSLFILFVTILLTFTGCFDEIKEPVLPNWDVDVNIPITSEEYELSEIIDTSNNIRLVNDPVYGDSIYFFVIDDIENSTSIFDSIIVPMNATPAQFPRVTLPNILDSVTVGYVYDPSNIVHVDSAEFKSGAFYMKVDNFDSQALELEFILPGFKDEFTGEILSEKRIISGNSSEDIILDLNDHNYAELEIGNSNDIENYETQESKGFFIVIKAGSSSPLVDFSFDVSSTMLVMDRLVGSMKRTDLGTQTVQVKTSFGNDIKNFAESINMKRVNFTLNIQTYGEMKNILVSDSLEITGYKKDVGGNLTDPLKLIYEGNDYINVNLEAGNLLSLSLNENNSNIIPFILNLPQSIEVKSRIVLDKNPNVSESEQVISSSDSIRFAINIEAPLIVSAENATLEDTTLISDELSQDDKDDIAQSNSATLVLEIENGIPLGITGKATFVDENYNPLFTIRSKHNGSESDVLKVDPAITDASGKPVSPTVNKIHLLLNNEEFQKFNLAKYILTEVKIMSSGYTNNPPLFVPVRAKDKVKFKIYGGVNYHFDPERE